jgi:hypothetical protein
MNKQIQIVLKQAILKSLPVLKSIAANSFDEHLVWRRQDNGWFSEYQLKPNFYQISRAVDNYLSENGAEFSKLLFENHPQYNGMVYIYRTMWNLGNIDHNYIFKTLIRHLWERHPTFNCNEIEVDNIIDEFQQLVNTSIVKYRFQSQLLNFKMTESMLSLSKDLRIRRLSEEEVSDFYGGSSEMLLMRSQGLSSFWGIHEFVIEGEDEISINFGDLPVDFTVSSDKIRPLLDKAILSLRTFKSGPIGYYYIHNKPLTFCPFPLGSYGRMDLYVPPGSYELSNEEIPHFCQYAELLINVSEPVMEMACCRLADAEIRTRPQDKIVDAVIGMEAVLLAGLGKDDRRGELKFRFSLHYSTLFDSPEEKYKAFRLAKDLYDLRSTIAHGGSLSNDLVRVGEEKLSLFDASKLATESLRKIIQYFIPKAKSAPYKKPDFWTRAYFNLDLE